MGDDQLFHQTPYIGNTDRIGLQEQNGAGKSTIVRKVVAKESLSPGELRKVMLPMGIVRAPFLIVMDEPTNHLDLHSIEALERVLVGCPCALTVVSHDARFLESLTTTRWGFSMDTHSGKRRLSVRYV